MPSLFVVHAALTNLRKHYAGICTQSSHGTLHDGSEGNNYIKCGIYDLRKVVAGAEFLFLTMHNFKAVTATGLKSGKASIQSLYYYCTTFTVTSHPASMGMTIASISCG